MRQRMRENLSKSSETTFDIKQDEGGLTDIEFLVDFLVLANASEYASLVEYPDNIRQLEALAREGLISQDQAQELTDCYLVLRQRLHELALNDQERLVSSDALSIERAAVVRYWREAFS